MLSADSCEMSDADCAALMVEMESITAGALLVQQHLHNQRVRHAREEKEAQQKSIDKPPEKQHQWFDKVVDAVATALPKEIRERDPSKTSIFLAGELVQDGTSDEGGSHLLRPVRFEMMVACEAASPFVTATPFLEWEPVGEEFPPSHVCTSEYHLRTACKGSVTKSPDRSWSVMISELVASGLLKETFDDLPSFSAAIAKVVIRREEEASMGSEDSSRKPLAELDHTAAGKIKGLLEKERASRDKLFTVLHKLTDKVDVLCEEEMGKVQQQMTDFEEALKRKKEAEKKNKSLLVKKGKYR